jgi:hypothetical protein
MTPFTKTGISGLLSPLCYRDVLKKITTHMAKFLGQPICNNLLASDMFLWGYLKIRGI